MSHKYRLLILDDKHSENRRMTVAQCLEFDISAQGHSVERALEAFHETFAAELLLADDLGVNLETIAPPAPPFYHRLYESFGVDYEMPKPKVSLPPDFVAESVLPVTVRITRLAA